MELKKQKCSFQTLFFKEDEWTNEVQNGEIRMERGFYACDFFNLGGDKTIINIFCG